MPTVQPLVEEFMELVKIGAASGDERGVATSLRAKLEEIGFQVTEDKAGDTFGGNCGNLIAVLEGGMKGSILFTSHMDRVTNGYNVHPRVESDRVVTDGTTVLAADDLSGAMAIIDGVRRIKASGKPFPRIEVLFCVGEEKCLFGSAALDASVLQSKLGFALDSPGNIGRIIKAAPCRSGLTCEVFGVPAHAGNEPEKGVNAVVVLAKILANIRDGRLDEDSTANFALLESKSPSVNIVQEYAKVIGETRSLHTEKVYDYIKYFEKHCQDMAAGTGATVKTTYGVEFASFDLPDDSATVSLAVDVFAQMGIKSSAEKAGGGMDANHLNVKGIECVGLATGYFCNHTVNEYLMVDDFLKSGEMVERLIHTYAQRENG